MAKINNTRNEVLEKMWLALLMKMQTGATTVENSVEVSQKVKNRTTLPSSNCTTRCLPKGYKTTYLKGYMYPDVYGSIINNSQIMESSKMPLTDE